MLFYLLVVRRHQPRRLRRHRVLETRDRPNDQRRATTPGCGTSIPALAALMTVFLLSLGGFPPLGGFIAKWYVFSAAIQAGYIWLAIIGVLTSVVSVFFYLRIVVMMYMTPADADGRAPLPAVPQIAGAALVVSALLVLYLGILPTRVLDWAAASIGAHLLVRGRPQSRRSDAGDRVRSRPRSSE